MCLWEAGLFRSFWFYGDVLVSRGTWVRMYVWHVGIKETYSDVYGSWIASSTQLTKCYWFHDGLAVSRETQGGGLFLFC